MTKEQVDDYIKYGKEFKKECKRIAKIFAKYDPVYRRLGDWEIINGKVYGSIEFYTGRDVGTITRSFNRRCLWMSDDMLETYGKQIIMKDIEE